MADRFNNSTRALVDEYSKFEVLPGLYINGSITLNENIADFAGITVGLSCVQAPREGRA
jgi:putative endopeptidase